METLAARWIREGYQRGWQEGYEQGLRLGREEGRQQIASVEIVRLLRRQLKRAPSPLAKARLSNLSVAQLYALSEALFEFKTTRDLTKWLRENAPQTK